MVLFSYKDCIGPWYFGKLAHFQKKNAKKIRKNANL